MSALCLKTISSLCHQVLDFSSSDCHHDVSAHSVFLSLVFRLYSVHQIVFLLIP